jgi:ribosome biogenesis GTPase / thiamine phosphate phosphatase
VLFQPLDDKQGVIERVEPRQGILARGHQYRQHILVANITQVLIVSSADDPPLKPALIDRFLVTAGKGEVRGLICINKCDLVDAAELQPVIGLYSRLGYSIVPTSTKTNLGIARLRDMLHGEATVISGQSGVGKSSLLNVIQPGLQLDTGEVSDTSKKGTHTTRVARLLQLEFGGWVVDTPGIRQMELWDVHPGEVEAYFVEFRPFVSLCRFPNCLHIEETGCAVKDAVRRDLISMTRYESYLRIVGGDD